MSGEATAAELNDASEIIMEDSGDVVIDRAEENDSLFNEVVPDIKDPRDVEDPGTVTAVEEDPKILDAENTTKDQADIVVDPAKEVKQEGNTPEPDAIAKLTEHKTNLEKALNASRAETKSLKFIIAQQENQPTQVDAPTKDVDPDFKILSRDEFEELKGESAVDALQYMHDLNEHKDALAETARFNDQIAREKATLDDLVAESMEQISIAVPGVYEDEAVGQKLTDYAIGQGFDNNALSILSNPATMVMVQGSKTPVPLGKTAVDFVKFCSNSQTGSDSTALRAEITKEVTATVTKDLLAKFKNNSGGIGLDSVPTSGSASPQAFVVKGEAELKKMSYQEREDYYQGK